MSWPQKITRSSYELINFYMSNSANWMHCSLHFTHFTEVRKIFNCFRACDKVSAECGTEMICSSRYETPGCASFDNRWSRFISFHSITFHSYSSFLLPTTGPQMILNDACSGFSARSSHIFLFPTFEEWFIMTGASQWPITPLRMSSSGPGDHMALRTCDTLIQALTLWNLIWGRCYPTQSNMGQHFILQNVEMGRVIH